MREIWFKVFTRYQKDPALIGEWVRLIKEDVRAALATARELVIAEAAPDALLLGFSPQILFAVASVSEGGLDVITSPEVRDGSIPPARFSHEVLELLRAEGVVRGVVTVPMAPSPSLRPQEVVARVREAVESVSPRVLDISGGTQLAALGAAESRAGLTYTYPLGDRVGIFRLR